MARKHYIPRVQGPLDGYAAAYFEYAKTLGYTDFSAGWQVWVMARLSQWMESANIELTSLTDEHVAEFIAHHRASHYRQPIGRRRLAPLLRYLRQQGLIPPVEVPRATPLAEFIERYRRFLTDRRNLAPRTVERHVKTAQRFLAPWEPRDGMAFTLETMAARDATTFLLRETERLSTGAAKNVLHQVRSLLRFGYQAGYLPQDLAVTLPPVASWHATRLPPVVPPQDIEALLHSCDDTPAPGRRDYGILLVLIRLGLRASEVCRLTLDDLDWRAGEIVVSGKGRRVDRLPLPVDVGAGIADYLQHERPYADTRQVFLTHRAPHRGMTRSDVSYVVRKACERGGLPILGAHRLRHALATTLLQQGATLPVIGQVLRHRDLASTAVYAKVDRLTLRSVAQPWPEVES